MELGTSIFLSSLFLGSVALFIATKDRWRWNRIVAWTFATVVLVGGLAGGAGYWYFTKKEALPFQAEFAGVKLGSSQADVLFRKGDPTKKEVSENGIEHWEYPVRGGYPEKVLGQVWIRFTNGTVGRVFYFGTVSEAPALGGPSFFVSQEGIEEQLGKPDSVSISEDSKRRIVAFDKYGLVYFMELNKVEGRGIYDPKQGRPTYAKTSEKQ